MKTLNEMIKDKMNEANNGLMTPLVKSRLKNMAKDLADSILNYTYNVNTPNYLQNINQLYDMIESRIDKMKDLQKRNPSK